MKIINKLKRKFFDYDIVGTYLEEISPGKYRTCHIKKYRIRKVK